MSAAASPRSTTSNDRSTSRTGNTPSLPSKFTVPPTPPQIHKRLRMSVEEDGLLLRPVNADPGLDDQGILIEWGMRKDIRRFDRNASSASLTENLSTTPTKKSINSASTTLDIGGIIGRSHLWETSYLLFFLPPPDLPPNKLFPSTRERQFPEELPSVTPLGSAEDELRKLQLASIGDESPANRTRSESTATVKQGYGGLYRRDTISGLSSEKHGESDPQDGSQGEYHTLKSVYALPLTKEVATEMITKLKLAMAKSKPKPKQRADPAPSTSTPNTGSQSTGNTSGTTTPADTPGRLFVKALNPQSWNILPGLTRNSSFQKSPSPTPSPSAPTTGDASRGTPSSTSDTNEDAMAMLADTSERETTAAREAIADGMPDPDTVMASVAGTQTLNEQKNTPLISRWTGVDKFIAGSGAAARAVGKGFNDMGKGLGAIGRRKPEDTDGKEGTTDQSVSLMEDDAASDTSETLTDDMMPLEGGILLTLPENVGPGVGVDQKAQPPTIAKASVSQRRDLEVKIVREMCRELGGGAFFYSHEVDLSHTLQHKRKQLTARTQSNSLLTSLLHRDDSSSSRDSLGLGDSPRSEQIPRGKPAGGLEPAADISGPDFSSASDEKDGGATWIEPDMNLPLWRRFDQRFMWNTWLLKEFVDLGLHEYILPVMQGWVQSSRFYIPPASEALSIGKSPASRPSTSSFESLLPPPSTPVDLVVISRRSKDRAGLRFQRRGMDEDGNVANFVETEMIIRVKVEDKWNIFSFVIIRGSIPLFWSQTSTLTAMKPAPVLDRPVKTSTGVTRLHFDDLHRRYGPQTIVNLAELTGKESVVTNGFKEVVADLKDERVQYREFDFHNECTGMHYENISKLIHDVDSTFDEQGYYWTCQGVLMRAQSGTFRVNCIDCLDRTAVVQSAFAHHVLISELTQVGVTPDSLNRDIDMVFNDIWANNGDAISRSYAGTSALKGDFTRTGKRDLTGMMHDGLNSLARMYSGAVSDFFAQAVISYMVGERSIAVFHEMLESLQSSDSSNIMRLSRIRAAAIEVSAARVIESGESLGKGWVLLAPEKAGMKFTLKLEEKILLLTRTAVYVVSFNYALEKVVDFTRIPLKAIKSIHKGAYIVNPLTEAGRDVKENAGFLLYFYPTAAETRLTTYSVLNHIPTTPTGVDDPPLLDEGRQYPDENLGSVLDSNTVSQYADSDAVEFFAFKALPRDFHTVDRSQRDEEEQSHAETCKEAVDRVVDRIKEEMVRSTKPEASRMAELVQEKDVIGLEEAEKQTSIVARADYALKKLLWLP